jgi:DNA topoisomerase VI subunit B
VRRLRDELGALRSTYAEREDLPGLRTLVEGMSIVAAGMEREIISESRQLHEGLKAGAEAAPAELRFRERIGSVVIALDTVLPRFLRVARSPHGREVEALIHPVTRLVARFFRQEVRSIELIFEPGDDYAYELSLAEELMPVADNLQPELREQLDDLPQMVVISYPQHLEAETLVHAMVVHEIAHMVVDYAAEEPHSAPIDDAFEYAENKHFDHLRRALAAPARRSRGSRRWRNRSRAHRPFRSPPRENFGRAAREVIDQRLRRWYDEFACDALAVGMIGPAYAFALADLDLASDRWAQLSSDGGSQSHPGLAWRLKRVIDQSRRDYLDQVGKDAPAAAALRDALDRLEAVIPDERDQLRPAERALLEAALKRLDKGSVVESVLGPGAHYSAHEFGVEIEIAWQKLHAGIPPAERVVMRDEPHAPQSPPSAEMAAPGPWSSPMPWPSIVNACYAYWQAGHGSSDDPKAHRVIPDHPRVAQDWMDFNAYVRGTIELANLHEQLSAARDRLDGLNEPRKT